MRFPNRSRVIRGAVVLALLLGGAVGHSQSRSEKRPLVLWHSYRGQEKLALEQLVARFRKQHQRAVETVALPHQAYAAKLNAAVPRGHGPDLFIFAHERIGTWVQKGMLRPLDQLQDRLPFAEQFPLTRRAVGYRKNLYGLPLAFKSLALFYNRKLVQTPPQTTAELLELGKKLRQQDGSRFTLAYATDEFYYHAPWLFGFGARLFDRQGRPQLNTKQLRQSLRFVRDLVLKERLIPQEGSTALATQLFNAGQVAMVINGPWFIGEIDNTIDFAVAPLPTVSETGLVAQPFLTVEALFFPRTRPLDPDALKLAQTIAGREGALVRAKIGRQSVSFAALYRDALAGDAVLQQFRAQMERSRPMSNAPQMNLVWEPGKAALIAALRGADLEETLTRAQLRLRASNREPPPEQSPLPYLLFIGLVGLTLAGWLLLRQRKQPASINQWRLGYAYIGPAFAGLLFIAIIPFAVAIAIGFCHHQAGDFTFVGLANFRDILFSKSYGIGDPLSFYFTLFVTVLWTVLNIALHLSLGVALALLLRAPWLQMRGVYRALLIIPWAVPNYITALIWRGMFHKQYGAINGLLELFGLEPVQWFGKFWTAFCANLLTNTWLGFPFMMVVALGALQSIPQDLYEAAYVDGASRWQRFRHITVPLLRPAMVPALLMGMIWTFNMFNVIYLVSGGEPDGATDILISEAYRWAFQRQEQYGYAAAYSTLIFCILVGYTIATRKTIAKEAT